MKFISLLSNKAISRLISLALILLFAIGIAPKQFLHDLFAHHTDKSVLLKASEIAHVHTSGFQCDTESTVATSPFEATGDIAYIQPKKIFQRHSSRLETPLFADSHRAIDLRGPPKVG